jgi:hypothetical protein
MINHAGSPKRFHDPIGEKKTNAKSHKCYGAIGSQPPTPDNPYQHGTERDNYLSGPMKMVLVVMFLFGPFG